MSAVEGPTPDAGLATAGPGLAAGGPALRPDLREAQRALLDHLRRPGTWFTGAERLAIAAESRAASACALCRARRQALSPEHAPGEHDRADAGPRLPDALVEIAHRVRSDPSRLSRPWFERQRAAGVATGPYVEAVGIVAMLAGVDAFCRALGVPPLPLPEALPGAPSRHTPDGLREGLAWVPLLEEAGGPEADLYDGPAAAMPNIVRALSAVPDAVRMLKRIMGTHYLPLSEMRNPLAGRALDRLQIELVAARVSALNECFY